MSRHAAVVSIGVGTYVFIQFVLIFLAVVLGNIQ